jgi:hypothetical protein
MLSSWDRSGFGNPEILRQYVLLVNNEAQRFEYCRGK